MCWLLAGWLLTLARISDADQPPPDAPGPSIEIVVANQLPSDTLGLAIGLGANQPTADTLGFRIEIPADQPPSDTLGLGIEFGADQSPADTLAPRSEIVVADPFPADTLGLRIEIGAGTDVTNEQYYQDAFLDTTFLGRQLVSTPEARYAGVVSALLAGTREERAVAFQLQNELSLGDKVQRETLSGTWRQDFAPDWRLSLGPSFEYRHDRTFDRDREEWRGGLSSRLRRELQVGTTFAELGAFGDLVRSSGDLESFVLDRNSAGGSLAFDHAALLGNEGRLGYRFTHRSFPDSSERDHFEHGWEGRWRQAFTGGHSISFDATGTRRHTQRLVNSTRDNFWEEDGAIEGDVRVTEAWRVRLKAEGEAHQYDIEDSTIFFDYQVARAGLGVRFERSPRWSVTVGPRVEALFSRLAPGEGYREVGGALEFEYLGAGSWWSVTPALGWRDYDDVPQSVAQQYPGLHSPYAFYELSALADQPITGGLRLRGLTALRYEAHTDQAQDARSVYLSAQLRWAAF